MTDTPRSDAAAVGWGQIGVTPEYGVYVHIELARELERELAVEHLRADAAVEQLGLATRELAAAKQIGRKYEDRYFSAEKTLQEAKERVFVLEGRQKDSLVKSNKAWRVECQDLQAELAALRKQVESLQAIADSDDGAGGAGMRLHLDNERLRKQGETAMAALEHIAEHYTDTALAAKHMSAHARMVLSSTGCSADYVWRKDRAAFSALDAGEPAENRTGTHADLIRADVLRAEGDKEARIGNPGWMQRKCELYRQADALEAKAWKEK